MKTHKLRLFPILLLLMAIVISCAKDKGNYDYTILDPVDINGAALPQTYASTRFTDYLDINPTVTFKGEVVNTTKSQFPELSFTWEMYILSGNKTTEKYTLANTQNLHHLMIQPEGTYQVVFTVTNTNTGVKSFAKFTASITPSLSEGWMVLYEKNGNSDVGVITNTEISKAVTTEKLFLDVYSASNGVPIQGSPGNIIFAKSANPTLSVTGIQTLYILSNKEIVNVAFGTFQKIGDPTYGIFFNKPAVIAPSFISSTDGRKDIIINNNKLHRVDYTQSGSGTPQFGDALAGNYGTLAQWLPSAVSTTAFEAIVYDQTNKKFLKLGFRGAEVLPFNLVQTSTAFDVNNVGLTFVMADMGINNWEYIVMKDAANKHFMLAANFREGETALIGKAKYDMSNCPEVTAINSVTTGYYGEVFYYSANNHLYQYKYSAGNTTDLLWTAPAGETITKIALQKYNSNINHAVGTPFDPKNLCKILYVATYNEATKVGTVYQMEVNVTNGAIIAGTQKSYTGFGKIKDMAWKIK